jgi:addiction module HigA family antidote
MIPLQRKPVHPGEVLREDFLKEYQLTAKQLAKQLRVSRSTIQKIVCEQGRITPNIALRLAKFFRTSAEVWLGLQNEFDLYREQQARKNEIRKIKPMLSSIQHSP